MSETKNATAEAIGALVDELRKYNGGLMKLTTYNGDGSVQSTVIVAVDETAADVLRAVEAEEARWDAEV